MNETLAPPATTRPSGWRLLFMLICSYFGAQAVAALALLLMVGFPSSLAGLRAVSGLVQSGRQVAITSSLGEIAIFAIAWLFMHRRMTVRAAGLDSPRLSYLGDGIALFLFVMLASIVFGLLLRTGDVRSQLAVAQDLHGWWEGPLIAVSAGFAEEVTFRGYLFTGLRRMWPNATWLAVLLSSIGFALAHVAWGLQPLQFVFYVVLGVLLAVGVLRARSVWPAIVAHAGWDALAFVLLMAKAKGI